MGDIKLAAVLGLFLGRAVGPAIFIALISGTLVGALIMARKGVAEGRKTAVPFGPFLALGGVVALFVGDAMVDWYLAPSPSRPLGRRPHSIASRRVGWVPISQAR